MKRLALTKSGDITWCVSSDENVGKGRCNHVDHQDEEESNEKFVDRINFKRIDRQYVKELRELIDFNGLETIPNSLMENGMIRLKSKKNFGSVKMVGNQFKGDLIIEDSDDILKKFIKLDAINPTAKGNWQSNTDYEHSSITEDICSRFLENISNSNMQSVSYDFAVFDIKGDIQTGTTSDNYMEINFTHELSIAPKSEMQDTLGFEVTFDEYYDGIATKSDFQTILNNSVDFFERYDVQKCKAKKFIIQQAGFDLIMGNEDRKQNPGNFIFLIPTYGEEDVIPLNMDYGRCLQVLWSKTSENSMKNFSNEKADEILNEMAEDEYQTFHGGGLFGGKDIKESVNFLMNNGFEPFEFNKNAFLNSFEVIEAKNLNNTLEFKHYIALKKKLIENILNNVDIKRLLKEGA